MAIRIHPTGFASEAWRIERDGEHLHNVRLDIHATGRGEYWILEPDRPESEVGAKVAARGEFTFDVWEQATVRRVLLSLFDWRGALVIVEIKRPTR